MGRKISDLTTINASAIVDTDYDPIVIPAEALPINKNKRMLISERKKLFGATVVFNRQVASYTLVLSDNLKMVEMNLAGVNNLTIPTNATVAFPIGTQILISQYGAGQTTIVPIATVTMRSDGGKNKLSTQYSLATLIKVGTNEWYLSGNIKV